MRLRTGRVLSSFQQTEWGMQHQLTRVIEYLKEANEFAENYGTPIAPGSSVVSGEVDELDVMGADIRRSMHNSYPPGDNP